MAAPNPELTQLESSGLIRLAQASPELEYLFRHALVQEAAYGSILKKDRKQLHLAVGEALERTYADRADELHGLLAYHYSRAEAWEQTLLHARAAADRAKRLYASAEALVYYDQALTALTHLETGDGAQSARWVDRFRILSARHGVWTLLGQFDGARADLEEMVALARKMEDDSRLADVLNGLGNFYMNTGAGDPRAPLEEALAVKRRLNDLAGQADSLNMLGTIRLDHGDVDPGLAAFRESRSLYERLGDLDGVSRSEWSVGAATYESVGDYEAAIESLQRALALTRQRGNRALECGSLLMMGAAHVRLGDYASARQCLGETHKIAEQIGDRQAEGWAALYLSWADREMGQWEAGLAKARRAETISRELGSIFQTGYTLFSLARLYLDMERPREAIAAAGEAREISRRQGMWLSNQVRMDAVLGRAHAATGDLEKAARISGSALQELNRRQGRGVPELQATYFDCYLALRQVDAGKARQVLAQARQVMLNLAERIGSTERRAKFFRDVTVNREISAAWKMTTDETAL